MATSPQTPGRERSRERQAHMPATQEGGGQCPLCGATIPVGAEYCPSCGGRLVDYCTFCGAPMATGETECPDCGAPARGVTCPKCGTLNHRAFCRQCNEPLTRAAVREVQRAAQDPAFQRVMALCDEALRIEEELSGDGADASDDAPDETSVPSEGARRLLEILSKRGTAGPAAPQAPAPAPPGGGAGGPSSAQARLQERKARYKALVKDIDALLSSMLPPAGTTPQEQRNYYSARMVAVKRRSVVRTPVEWVCNYCGCHHPQPSDCVRPELGGYWIYRDIETETIKFQRET